MSKNKKLEERTRTFFIQAAMSILRSEGLQCISARNVADQAGYSYATLYNYFKDMKDLVLECMEEFRQECLESVRKETAQTAELPLAGRVKEKLHSLIKYFIQYPGIYDLFYLEKIGPSGLKAGKADRVVTLIQEALGEDWALCGQDKPAAQEQILFTFSGALLLYMNRGYPGDYGELLRKVDFLTDQILEESQAV